MDECQPLHAGRMLGVDEDVLTHIKVCDAEQRMAGRCTLTPVETI